VGRGGIQGSKDEGRVVTEGKWCVMGEASGMDVERREGHGMKESDGGLGGEEVGEG